MKKTGICDFLVVIAVLLFEGNAIADDQATLMDEFLETFVGTWQTNMVLEEDVSGQGKMGDELPFVGTNQGILKGNAMESSWRFGSARGKALGVVDREEKGIRFQGADSTGTVLCIIYMKKDGQWVAKLTFSEADGTKRTSSGILTISDRGDTHTWVYSQRRKMKRRFLA